ncbi:hypothetical protein FRC02_005528 [Tulasnella sp. 418]|nr:hypothetical protein FRC02_005528 [Tulasnella sp. 418]
MDELRAAFREHLATYVNGDLDASVFTDRPHALGGRSPILPCNDTSFINALRVGADSQRVRRQSSMSDQPLQSRNELHRRDLSPYMVSTAYLQCEAPSFSENESAQVTCMSLEYNKALIIAFAFDQIERLNIFNTLCVGISLGLMNTPPLRTSDGLNRIIISRCATICALSCSFAAIIMGQCVVMRYKRSSQHRNPCARAALVITLSLSVISTIAIFVELGVLL